MFPNQIKVSTLLALFELYMLAAGHLWSFVQPLLVCPRATSISKFHWLLNLYWLDMGKFRIQIMVITDMEAAVETIVGYNGQAAYQSSHLMSY